MPLALPVGEVHLWYARQDELTEDDLVARYRALLSTDERERGERYLHARHRHEFLVTRALVRTVLSRYADVSPARWSFRANAFGRPEIDATAGLPSLRFNLSNTEGLCACAVTCDADVGVDVEHRDRPGETVEIAHRYFSAREVAALRALPPASQRDRFFDCWTLKEAYIKARGMGLSIPLDRFSMVLDPPSPIRVEFAPELPDDPASWHFETLRPTARHVLAVAVRRTPGGPAPALAPVLIVRPTRPLVDVP